MTNDLWFLAALSLLFTLAAPGESASAQNKTSWALPTTVGFLGLGCGAGYAAGREARRASAGRIDSRSFETAGVTALTIGGCWLGMKVGLELGQSADSILAAGEELPVGARRGVQLGTVLAGATLAALVSFIPASMQDGSDLPIVATYSLTGAAVGLLSLVPLNRYLYPRRSYGEIRVGGGAGGGVAFRVVYRF